MGLYLGLTGCRLGTEDLLRTGLATHYVSSDRISKLESEITSKCAVIKDDVGDRRKARDTVCGILDHFHLTNSAFDKKKSLSTEELKAIERSFTGKESVEEILVSLEKDLLVNNHLADWISKTIKQIKKLPPTSLKITFALMAHTRNLTLRQCLESEYRMMMRCMSGELLKQQQLSIPQSTSTLIVTAIWSDSVYSLAFVCLSWRRLYLLSLSTPYSVGPNFKEGIRAALIDKDAAPLWTPNTLADVSEDDVRR